MKNNFNIGERIHDLRLRKGLSQEQLALRAGITTTYLGLLERNSKNPTIRIVEKICFSMEIGLDEFFSTSLKPTTYPDEVIEQLISQISNRTLDEKQMIFQIVKNILKLRDLSGENSTEK